MGHILGAIGALLIGLIVLAYSAGGIQSGFSKAGVASTEENLIILRMQVQQFFNGTNYDGLTNDVARRAGIVPDGFLKGENLRNAWGGNITLAPDTVNGQFSIELQNIPQSDCTQLARFQPDAWVSVSINGSEVDSSDPAAVTEACAATNTLTYTAR